MSSDCLVLQINNNSSDDLNVNVFIIYDINSKLFVICGKRNGGVEFNYKSYSVKSTETFLYFIFSNKRYLNYSISNHSELPASHEEITYDYLNESLFENVYEIAYISDDLIYSTSEIKKFLKMLKNVFNYY
jgi:hypothetical protein